MAAIVSILARRGRSARRVVARVPPRRPSRRGKPKPQTCAGDASTSASPDWNPVRAHFRDRVRAHAGKPTRAKRYHFRIFRRMKPFPKFVKRRSSDLRVAPHSSLAPFASSPPLLTPRAALSSVDDTSSRNAGRSSKRSLSVSGTATSASVRNRPPSPPPPSPPRRSAPSRPAPPRRTNTRARESPRTRASSAPPHRSISASPVESRYRARRRTWPRHERRFRREERRARESIAPASASRSRWTRARPRTARRGGEPPEWKRSLVGVGHREFTRGRTRVDARGGGETCAMLRREGIERSGGPARGGTAPMAVGTPSVSSTRSPAPR